MTTVCGKTLPQDDFTVLFQPRRVKKSMTRTRLRATLTRPHPGGLAGEGLGPERAPLWAPPLGPGTNATLPWVALEQASFPEAGVRPCEESGVSGGRQEPLMMSPGDCAVSVSADSLVKSAPRAQGLGTAVNSEPGAGPQPSWGSLKTPHPCAGLLLSEGTVTEAS